MVIVITLRISHRQGDQYLQKEQTQPAKLRKYGAFPYDSQLLSWDMEARSVSIWTLGGRQQIGFVCSRSASEPLQGERTMTMRATGWTVWVVEVLTAGLWVRRSAVFDAAFLSACRIGKCIFNTRIEQ